MFMGNGLGVDSGVVVGKKKTDMLLRERLCAWLVYYMDEFGISFDNQGEFADKLGFARPSLSQYLNKRRTMGLDNFVRMHRKLHVSADVLLGSDPPPKHDPAQASRQPMTRRPGARSRAPVQSTPERE